MFAVFCWVVQNAKWRDSRARDASRVKSNRNSSFGYRGNSWKNELKEKNFKYFSIEWCYWMEKIGWLCDLYVLFGKCKHEKRTLEFRSWKRTSSRTLFGESFKWTFAIRIETMLLIDLPESSFINVTPKSNNLFYAIHLSAFSASAIRMIAK